MQPIILDLHALPRLRNAEKRRQTAADVESVLGFGKIVCSGQKTAGITQERLAELVDISTNHLGAIEREVKTPTMETFVKLLNVLGAEPNEVLKEVIPLTRMEHTSVVEGKLERLTPKKQESVLRMLDVIIEEMMK